MTFYKLRHRETGEFAMGGNDGLFGKKGKTWNAVGHVRAHLSQYRYYAEHAWGAGRERAAAYLAVVEIVEYTATAIDEKVIPA